MKTSVIIFSYDRPLQCDLLLNSFMCNISSLELDKFEATVLYGASNDRYDKAYQICIKENPEFNYIKQSDFKSDLKSLLENNTPYVFFITDDTIFTNSFSIYDAELALDNKDVLNFSYRLGKNTTICYPLSTYQSTPEHQYINSQFMIWKWANGLFDWRYPLEVSSSVLRKSSFMSIFNSHNFSNPNLFEWYMQSQLPYLRSHMKFSMAYLHSVAFSAPMNTVNKNNTNRASNKNEYQKDNLLKKYEQGMGVDQKDYFKFISHAAHEEVCFNFIERNQYE